MQNRNIEYGSYATHLERRVLMPCWYSSYRRAGRFVFKTMTRPDPDGTHWDLTIGHEMTLDYSRPRYGTTGNRSSAEDKWIFRAFLDGTAFFHKSRLESNLYHYGARRKIYEVIKKHYNLDTTITPDDNRYGSIEVYKRKPLSEYSRTIALAQEQSLGEYLVRKYNTEANHATAV
jgi:hypothetical protein